MGGVVVKKSYVRSLNVVNRPGRATSCSTFFCLGFWLSAGDFLATPLFSFLTQRKAVAASLPHAV